MTSVVRRLLMLVLLAVVCLSTRAAGKATTKVSKGKGNKGGGNGPYSGRGQQSSSSSGSGTVSESRDDKLERLQLITNYVFRNATHEERLLQYLFKEYEPIARAVMDTDKTVTVSIDFVLLRIHGLDEKFQVLTTTGLVIAEWTDDRLVWNPEDFGNLTSIIVKAEKLWLPELAVMNGAEELIPDFERIRVLLHHDGRLHWEPGGIFRTTCDIDIAFFPFDSQRCPLLIGAYSYHSTRMNITNASTTISTHDFRVNGEWEVVATTAEWGITVLNTPGESRSTDQASTDDEDGAGGLEPSGNLTGGADAERNNETAVTMRRRPAASVTADVGYAHVVFTLHLKRRYKFYIMNIVLPCVMLSVLIMIGFCLPPDAGEKISLGISVLLAFTVFLLMIAETIPKTSLAIPLIVTYLMATMTLGTVSVCMTVLVLNVHHRGPAARVPPWLRRLVLVYLARCVGMWTSARALLSRDGCHGLAAASAEVMRSTATGVIRMKMRDMAALAAERETWKGQPEKQPDEQERPSDYQQFLPPDASVVAAEEDAVPRVNNVANTNNISANSTADPLNNLCSVSVDFPAPLRNGPYPIPPPPPPASVPVPPLSPVLDPRRVAAASVAAAVNYNPSGQNPSARPAPPPPSRRRRRPRSRSRSSPSAREPTGSRSVGDRLSRSGGESVLVQRARLKFDGGAERERNAGGGGARNADYIAVSADENVDDFDDCASTTSGWENARNEAAEFDQRVIEEWHEVARVLDRAFFWFLFTLMTVTSLVILMYPKYTGNEDGW